MTKQKLIDITNGHLNIKDAFDINIKEKLNNDYVKDNCDITEEM